MLVQSGIKPRPTTPQSGTQLTEALSTLMRFRLKTHTFFYPFSPSVHTNTIENGGFRKRSLEWRFLKTEVGVFVWTSENGGFRKRLRHWHWHVPVSLVRKKHKQSIQHGRISGIDVVCPDFNLDCLLGAKCCPY